MKSKKESVFDIFNDYAEMYQSKYMGVDDYAEALDMFDKLMTARNFNKVLDVACGPANISKYLYDHNSNLHISGIDLVPKMIEFAKKNIPSGTFQVLDVNRMNELETQYDGIICGFLLPYLNIEEVEIFIKNSHKQLASNGLLYISTIEHSELYKSGTSKDVTYELHKADTIKVLLESNGFKLLFFNTLINIITSDLEYVLIAEKLS